MTLLLALILLIAAARWAPDSTLAKGLHHRVTGPIARWLATRTRGEVIVYAAVITLLVGALTIFGVHALRGLIFLSPEMILWAGAVVEFGTYADVLAVIIGFRLTARVVDLVTAIRLILPVRASRRRRVRRDRALPPANDDEADPDWPNVGWIAEAMRKRA